MTVAQVGTLSSEFERDGFVVVRNFLNPVEIQAALADARALAEITPPDPARPDRDYWGVRSRRVAGPQVMERAALRAIAEKPRLREIAEEILGRDCVYDGTSVQMYMPHDQHRQSWHTDTDPDDAPFFYVTMTTYLQDQSRKQGLTRLVPGSQHFPMEKRLPDHDDLPGQVALEVPAGTLCAFRSTVWHNAAENRSDEPRFVVIHTFARPEFSRANAGKLYGRMRHSRGPRRSGKPLFDHPTNEGSYPWPEAYDLAHMPYMKRS